MATFDVGARLRTLRDRMALSQRELAKRAGVTNSTISLIEQNRVSPSVASLKKVLEGLPVSLAEFFAGDDPQPRKIFYTNDDMTELTFDAIRYKVVGGGAAADRRITVMRELYEPGADTGAPGLIYDGEEGGFVLSGRIEITVGEEICILKPGEGYFFETNRPHRFRNPFEDPCELVSASTNSNPRKQPRA